MRFHPLFSIVIAMSLIASMSSDADEANSQRKPNVLMIVIDDLNDWISILGHPTAITPNFDRLARRSVTFENAYCPAPICCPSRTSFLTGVHPSKSGAYFNNQRFFTSKFPIGKATTLPGHFKKNGYDVVSYGKVFHVNRTGIDIKETEIDFIKTDFICCVRMMSGPQRARIRYLPCTIVCNARTRCLARLLVLKFRFGLRQKAVRQPRCPAFDARMHMNRWARNAAQ